MRGHPRISRAIRDWDFNSEYRAGVLNYNIIDILDRIYSKSPPTCDKQKCPCI